MDYFVLFLFLIVFRYATFLEWDVIPVLVSYLTIIIGSAAGVIIQAGTLIRLFCYPERSEEFFTV